MKTSAVNGRGIERQVGQLGTHRGQVTWEHLKDSSGLRCDALERGRSGDMAVCMKFKRFRICAIYEYCNFFYLRLCFSSVQKGHSDIFF